ncbi:gas vesicle protein [Mucilaginibacter sp. SG538B]|uniref:hypothetical protein n=1 Tax=Mucilaginibacter sp. SG538B TaxID=2587021 RepID=UPI00159E34B1|nr:hypothetical protein [Mucilaginibacter sp. SG538B]NVM66876.1 gas vesicle protein [Mucilaginibacter sp. SG538B]
MKYNTIHFVCIIFLLSGNIVKGQQVIDNYKNYNIRNSSCEIINSVNIEMGKPAYSNAFSSLRSEAQAVYPLQKQSDVDGYIRDFNLTLDNTKKRYESQEFLWKTGREIGKYGLSVLGSYADAIPSKYLTKFLTPAIQQGYELYVDHEIEEGVNEHKEDIDKLIKDRINLLYTNGIDVRTASDGKAFEDMFALAHGEIPALNRDQYGIFNKELTKRAYDFIAANRAEIQLINLKTTQQYEEVKQQVNTKIDDFQKQITNEVNTKFKELGNSIAELTENQTEIFKTLNNIQDRVKANETKIASLEKEMVQFKDDVVQLKAIQEEHDKLIAQNSFQIDILSGYTFQNLNTTQKINALEKGHFDNIFKPDEKQKLLGDLKDIKTKETIISVASDINNYSQAAYGGLVNAGILKGKAAQTVGKLMNVVSIATGIARVYAGDLTGLVSIVSGIGGLFSKPTPSPEMQMLTQMYEVMNKRFDKIDQHLDIIETKLDTLASITINMYKTMVLAFQFTGNQLDRINWKVDNLNVKATALLYNDYQACKTLKDIWKSRKVSFNSYSDYQAYYGQECKQCLQGLTDFTIGKNNSYFYVSSNEQLKNEEVVRNEITEIYEPTRNLFTLFYSQNLNSATYALMFPFALTKDANKPLYYVSKIDNLKLLDTKQVFDNYFSYEMINEFTDLFLVFGNYFLIKGSNDNFKPLTINNYLRSDQINGVNQDLLETRLTKLLNIVQYSISQQSLMSGNLMLDPIYSTLFNFSSDENAKDLAIKTLNNNKLLATNFAIYLLNKNLDFTDTLKVKKLFSEAATDSQSLDNLNSLVSLNDIKFSVDDSSKKLQLSFERKGQTINILCPDFTSVLENKMINSDAIYSLLDSRQKINSKLIDLTFTNNLQSTSETAERFKYYYDITK